jgi:hypothetical protein
VPEPDSQIMLCQEGNFHAYAGDKEKEKKSSKVHLSPRHIPDKVQETYTTSKNKLYAELISNIMTKVNTFLSK